METVASGGAGAEETRAALTEIRRKFQAVGQQQISDEEAEKTEGEKIGGEIANQMQAFNKENIQVLKGHMNTEPKVFYSQLDGEVR